MPSKPAAAVSLPERLLNEGRFAEAAIALRAQLELAPQRADLRRGLARALEASGNLTDAIDALRPFSDREAETQRRRLREKLLIYERVASLFPGGRVRPADAGSSRLQVGTVEVRYPGTEPPAALPALVAAAERALRLVKRRLGWCPASLPVELVPPGEAMADDGDRSWITALVSDGLMRIRLEDLTQREPQHLAVVVTHEVVHIVVDHLSAGRAPAWLGEGLAIHLSQALPTASKKLLDDTVARDASIPLEILARPFAALRERDLVRVAYAQAASLVGFLEERHGDGCVAELVHRLADLSLDEALRPLRLNTYLLEREWIRWKRK